MLSNNIIWENSSNFHFPHLYNGKNTIFLIGFSGSYKSRPCYFSMETPLSPLELVGNVDTWVLPQVEWIRPWILIRCPDDTYFHLSLRNADRVKHVVPMR
jgi:hypothetical protein